MWFLIDTGIGLCLLGLLLISASVAALILSIKQETTKLDHYLVRIIIAGFLLIIVGIILLVSGLVIP